MFLLSTPLRFTEFCVAHLGFGMPQLGFLRPEDGGFKPDFGAGRPDDFGVLSPEAWVLISCFCGASATPLLSTGLGLPYCAPAVRSDLLGVILGMGEDELDPGRDDSPGDLKLVARLGEVVGSSPRRPLAAPCSLCLWRVDFPVILVVSPDKSLRLIDFSVGLCRLSLIPSLESLLFALLFESRRPFTSAVFTDSREDDRDLDTLESTGILSPELGVFEAAIRDGRGNVLVFLGATIPPLDESLDAFLRNVGVVFVLFSEESCRVRESLVFLTADCCLFLGIVPYGDCLVFFFPSKALLGFCMLDTLSEETCIKSNNYNDIIV